VLPVVWQRGHDAPADKIEKAKLHVRLFEYDGSASSNLAT
jgi:hypothetical protein